MTSLSSVNCCSVFLGRLSCLCNVGRLPRLLIGKPPPLPLEGVTVPDCAGVDEGFLGLGLVGCGAFLSFFKGAFFWGLEEAVWSDGVGWSLRPGEWVFLVGLWLPGV